MRGGREVQRGFSLIELMMVLVIVAIVAGLAYPSVRSTLAEARLHAAAREVINLLQFARMQAVLNGTAYQVALSPAPGNGPGGTLEVRAGTSNVCDGFRPEVLRSIDLMAEFEEVGLVGVFPQEVVADTLCFKPDGRVYDGRTGLPPLMDDPSAFHTRPSTVALVLRRFEGDEAVGVRREVLLPHLGVPRLNELR